MTVTIFHGPRFGHAVEVVTETKGRPRENFQDSVGRWHGIGVPEEVYRGILASVDAILSDHLVARYGLQESLECWGVEPEPF
jgi:hypothetical protein